ncbi:Di- and tricarboxylate transporter [Tistlia consotensis]|uniref:Di-and tricarboxylate transporter n=1 Tax=Tistlia consotensis USBA 355 TaxID=560819 RepID=A0A1Y6CEY9_9PROT|nr:SLC13 family permease [Tistlia consotensis]SMF60864.1 Di-and tricarboxylate transporter [Tistlia consotensis USBA 355]SNR92589.1 Di- and tricarboxylate transporter [Tistlia consotensis]
MSLPDSLPDLPLPGDQLLLFGLLALLVGLLVWGRIRYDIVAFGTLLAAVLLGLVSPGAAFGGFGHPATITVALVLVASRILADTGATEALARAVLPFARRTSSHVGILAGIGSLLSGFMNNVGTLALLMPMAIDTAKKAERPVAALLMPLSFATILGGLLTLIGTPPNLIVSGIRAQYLDAPFAMFDFTPVGGAVALVGVLFIALLGWRLVPARQDGAAAEAGLFDIESYLAEVLVPKDSAAAGLTLQQLYEKLGDSELQVVGRLRRGRHLAPVPRSADIGASDHLLLEGSPEAIDKAVGELGLKLGAGKGKAGLLKGEETELREALIQVGSRCIGRSAAQLRFVARYRVNLLGVSRQGRAFRGRVRDFRFEAGDVLLLHGEPGDLDEAQLQLGLLPLAGRGLTFGLKEKGPWVVGLFAAAVVAASLGLAPIAVTLGVAIAAMAAAGLVAPSRLYEGIDWPVIVLLGSLMPVGAALQSTGATDTIAGAILALGADWPPWLVLVLVLVVTMTLSDVLNNAATAIVMAPIGIALAERLKVNPDAFLMAVAVGASCAFLTPVGHQNNALILGPGGYRFGDYWRMGLPLELLICLVAVPAILLVWPL